MPNKDTPTVGIFCRDARFCRLLEIQLALCGAIRVVDLWENPDQASECLLWLVDFDEFPCAALPQRPQDCRVYGWTRGEVADNEMAEICWHRPFSMTAFEAAVSECLNKRGEPTEMIPATGLYHRIPPAKQHPRDAVLRVVKEGLVAVDGVQVPLTNQEWRLFACLWDKRGSVVSKEELRGLLDADCVQTNRLEVYICFLRRKLEGPTGRKIITTVRGVGYRLEKI